MLNLKKKNFTIAIYVMFIQCFTKKSCGFTKILKVETVFFKSVLSSSSDNTGPVTRDHVKSF